MVSEVWKTIPGYPDYEVSSHGRVRCYLKQSPFAGKKYLRVSLEKKGFRVHRLVLEAFVGPCPPGMQACHKDDDQTNNHLDNLRWGTFESNVEDKLRNGKQVRGEAHPRTELTESEVQTIKQELDLAGGKYGTARAIAQKFGVAQGVVYNIKYNKSWKHIS